MLSVPLTRCPRFLLGWRWFLVWGGIALAAAFSHVVATPAAQAAAEAPEGMRETVLPGGLRVVLRPIRGNPVICTTVLVRAGVAWEPEGLSGASHFLEHLLFNGTTTRTQEQLYADVDRIGGYNNATTRADHTLFLLLAPSEHLERALEIQADMLFHSTLPPDKFEKEKGIVLEELGKDTNNPSNLATYLFEEKLYEGTPYARPVLGTAASIRGLTREAVEAYYHERYRPDRMILLLAGDFDEERALELIGTYFGGAREAGSPAAGAGDLPPARLALGEAGARVVHQRVEAGRTYLRAAWPAPDPESADAEAFGLLVSLAGNGEGSAVGRALRGGERPAVFDFSLSHETLGGAGALVLHATLTGSVSPREVVGHALEALRAAPSDGSFSPEDLQRLREANRTEAATLEEQVHYYAMFRAPALLRSSAKDLDAHGAESTGLSSLARVAREVLGRPGDPSPPLLVTISGPEESDGAEETWEGPLASGSAPGTGAAVARGGLASRPAGEVPPPRPASPPAAEAMAPVPPTSQPVAGGDVTSAPAGGGEPAGPTSTLANGLVLSVRTEPASGVFAVHVLARNRSALEPPERPGLADLVQRLLLRGTLARDALALEAELGAIGARIKLFDDPRFPFDDYYTTPLDCFVRLETTADHAGAALRLLAEILQTPRFDPAEIRKSAAEMRDLARRAEESSGARSSRRLRQLLAAEHSFARPVGGTVDSLEGVTAAEVRGLYERLYDPSNLIVSIRGGGQPQAVRRRARAAFGGWGPAGGWRPRGEGRPAGGGRADAAKDAAPRSPTRLAAPPPVTREPRRGEEVLGKMQGYLRMGAVVEVAPEDRPALAVAMRVLSDRLQMDLRERQGLAYTIGAGLEELGGGRVLAGVSMGTAPDNLEHAESEIRKLIASLHETVVGEEEVARLVAARRGRILMRRLTSLSQAFYDGLHILHGHATEGDLSFLEAMRSIGPEEVREALRRYVRPETWCVAIVR